MTVLFYSGITDIEQAMNVWYNVADIAGVRFEDIVIAENFLSNRWIDHFIIGDDKKCDFYMTGRWIVYFDDNGKATEVHDWPDSVSEYNKGMKKFEHCNK